MVKGRVTPMSGVNPESLQGGKEEETAGKMDIPLLTGCGIGRPRNELTNQTSFWQFIRSAIVNQGIFSIYLAFNSNYF
ncbi:hypothetical protein ECG_02462 [Echinococcus granulosus]|nr:hypothetical protein ECG_02462 [Echinococcus granulosus]